MAFAVGLAFERVGVPVFWPVSTVPEIVGVLVFAPALAFVVGIIDSIVLNSILDSTSVPRVKRRLGHPRLFPAGAASAQASRAGRRGKLCSSVLHAVHAVLLRRA